MAHAARLARAGRVVRVLDLGARAARGAPPAWPTSLPGQVGALLDEERELSVPFQSARALRALGVRALLGASTPSLDGLEAALSARVGPGLAGALSRHAALRFGAHASVLDAGVWPSLLAPGRPSVQVETSEDSLEVLLEAGGDWVESGPIMEVEVFEGRVVALLCEHGWEACEGGVLWEGFPPLRLGLPGLVSLPEAATVGVRLACERWRGPEDLWNATPQRAFWRARHRAGRCDLWFTLGDAHPLRAASDAELAAFAAEALGDRAALVGPALVSRRGGGAPVPRAGVPQAAAKMAASLAPAGVTLIGGFERGALAEGGAVADARAPREPGASRPPWGPTG